MRCSTAPQILHVPPLIEDLLFITAGCKMVWTRRAKECNLTLVWPSDRELPARALCSLTRRVISMLQPIAHPIYHVRQ
jgi:hypothetical protein